MLVTGRSALFLDGIVEVPPDNVELLVPASRRLARRPGICLHRTTVYDTVRSKSRGPVRISAIPRGFADYAAHATVNDLCRDLATAIRKRRCSLPTVASELTQRRKFPGSGRLRVAHGLLLGELTHSADERLGRRLLRAAGVQCHRQPLTVEHSGRLIAEIDIPLIDSRYGVEIDGPHHLLANVAAADRARDRELQRLGWIVDRFFWFELEERPGWFVEQVTRRVAELTHPGAAAPTA